MKSLTIKKLYGKTFLIAIAIALVLFVPAMIIDQGYFLFVGDFNSQQIPFYKIAHHAIRNGEWGWNWYTDIGANFIASYSFYLLGSPFFWMTIPFPNDFVPYLMGPLLILKFGCAAVMGTAYLKRYVKNQEFAMLGGVLYAFCGYSIYNIFFNHFHEAIIFFPLLLIAMDEYMDHGTRGVLALAVCANALVNYFFFVGEVVFVVIYYFVRIGCQAYERSWKKFFTILLEAVIGFIMSGILMLPSILTVLQNPRVDNPPSGFGMWLYSSKERLPAILLSFLFPPDLPSKQVLLPDANTKWTSLSAYLPLFNACGALAFIQTKRRSWLSYLLKILLLMALVPGLNSLFVAFNASYYARWFYMLTLMLILATVLALDHGYERRLRRNSWQVLAVTLVVVVALAVTPQFKDGQLDRIGLYDEENWLQFIVISITAVLSLLALIQFLPNLRKRPHLFVTQCLTAVCIISILYGNFFVFWGKSRSYDTKNYLIPDAIQGEEKITIPDKEELIRIDADDALINMGMFWKVSCMRAFHSIVPASLMEFYTYIGESRNVNSKIPESQYAVRGLLSVHWYFDRLGASDTFGDPENQEAGTLMPGYRYYDQMAGYNVWENEFYIPMGFVYDEYILKSELDNVADSNKAAAMLQAVALTDEQAYDMQRILSHVENVDKLRYTEAAYKEACKQRAAKTVDAIWKTKTGVMAQSSFAEKEFVFFGIPWEEGWSAYIDGEPVKLEKVNVGFMGLVVPEGTHEIELRYRTPGLTAGAIGTFGGAAALLLYWLIGRRWDQKQKNRKQALPLEKEKENEQDQDAAEPV
ncbi:MAG: YfhO family protein [Lachnospiraceae bacterium]|jgi:uncharacterized membrane protein YfhO|nr:YfhO family protein [Lachnospiraceae bacterium]